MNTRRGSLYQRYPYVIRIAFILCHLLRKQEGFRLKDVKFYCDLVSNWISFDRGGQSLDIQLVQVKRIIQLFHEQRWLTAKGMGHGRSYTFTYAGFIDLLQSLQDSQSLVAHEEVLLLHYCLRTYRHVLLDRLFSPDIYLGEQKTMALLALLDPAWPVQTQLQHLNELIRSIDSRIQDNQKMNIHIEEALAQGQRPADIIPEISRRFSYQMSYQKTFKELLSDLPEDLLQFEIGVGLRTRNELLFVSLKKSYEVQRNFLAELLENWMMQSSKQDSSHRPRGGGA